jgi:hypothetical protein
VKTNEDRSMVIFKVALKKEPAFNIDVSLIINRIITALPHDSKIWPAVAPTILKEKTKLTNDAFISVNRYIFLDPSQDAAQKLLEYLSLAGAGRCKDVEFFTIVALHR